MGRGRTNRSEYAKGPFVNITARVSLGVWSMIERYANANCQGNRSVAIERMIREAEASYSEWKKRTLLSVAIHMRLLILKLGLLN